MGFDRQQRALSLLSVTGLWERFGNTALQAILVLYMTQSLALTEDSACLLYGTFSSLLYLAPVFGGYFADRYLGLQRSLLMGAFLMMVGYLLCALPQAGSFFAGLSVLIIAQGFFRPGLLGLASELQGEWEGRGLTWAYMGIQWGALFPPLLTGYLGRKWGWHWGFPVAALAMAAGVFALMRGRSRLRALSATPAMSIPYPFIYAAVIGCVGVILFLLHFPAETSLLLGVALMVVLGIMLRVLLKDKGIHACLVLVLISVGFWALYTQTFTAIMLYADRHMEHQLFGVRIDAPFLLFFNPLFILLLGPVLGRLGIFSAQGNRGPTLGILLSLGLLCMALGFFLLGFGGVCCGGGRVAASWLVGSYFLQTLGELLLFSVGIAVFTQLAQKHFSGHVMNVWFLIQAAGCAIGGGLATLGVSPIGYDRAFFLDGGLALCLAVAGFALIPALNRKEISFRRGIL